MESSMNKDTKLVMDLKIEDNSFDFASSIDSAILEAEGEMAIIDETIEDSKESIIVDYFPEDKK